MLNAYQALSHMGKAAHQIAWANTYLADVEEIPAEIKAELKSIHNRIYELQMDIREGSE